MYYKFAHPTFTSSKQNHSVLLRKIKTESLTTTCPFDCHLIYSDYCPYVFYLFIKTLNPFIMKKIFSNNRLIAIAFVTVFSLGAVAPASALEKSPAVPVALKYTGQVNNQPVFELSFNGSSQQDNFTIVISDEYGNSLYRENIKGEIFTKKFALNTDELGDNNIRFEIFCNKTKNSVTYEINRNTRVVHEVAVVEIK